PAAGSPVRTLAASGAVSGTMVGYLVLYPRVRVHTLFVILIFIRIIPVPAWLVLGQWFVLQFLYGATLPTTGGGVAFWAHVGGFVTGVALIKLFEKPKLVGAKKRHVKLPRRVIEDEEWW